MELLNGNSERIAKDRKYDQGEASPLISVIVFVLNAAQTIDRALRSVTADDQPQIELLVMDGGSTDGTLEVIRKYQSKLAYWRSRRDGSAAIAINEGVERATGRVICLLPADDWIEAGALHIVAKAFRADAELQVLSCGTRVARVDKDGSIFSEVNFIDMRVLDFRMSNIVRCPLTAGRFISRRLYKEVGGYNPVYLISNDLDFLIRVLMRRPKSQVQERLVYTYRRHPGSRTLGGDPMMIMEMMREFVRVAEHHLDASPLDAAERTALLGLHGRACARLGWMTAVRGEVVNGARAILKAIRRNRAFPFMVFVWIAQKLLRRGNPF